MHQNIFLLKAALAEIGLIGKEIKGFPDGVVTPIGAFIRASTPFNSESVSVLCRDKAAVYSLLLDKVPQPHTDILFDSMRPFLSFLYPCIVKMNAGERGIHVFLVSDEKEKDIALSHIFNKESRHYDYIALIQEYIKPLSEIRVIIAAGEVSCIYDRDTQEVVLGDGAARIESYARVIIKTLGLSWGALDFIQDESGKFYFLEANTKPSFEKMVQKNGGRLLLDAYIKAITHVMKQ